MEQEFTETTSTLARAAGVTSPTIVKYARLGLLEFITASNGARLFRRGQGERAKEIFANRTAGRRHRQA